MLFSQRVAAHDIGLPEPVIRKRRRSRRLATLMLIIAVITATAGWPLFGSSVQAAIKIREQPASLAFIAYGLLIISSVTLVLGLWYLLLAQVERVARMVDTAELEAASTCRHCTTALDAADRFCPACGKPQDSPRGDAKETMYPRLHREN